MIREVIINMMQKELSMDEIAKSTGLSHEAIESIIRPRRKNEE